MVDGLEYVRVHAGVGGAVGPVGVVIELETAGSIAQPQVHGFKPGGLGGDLQLLESGGVRLEGPDAGLLAGGPEARNELVHTHSDADRIVGTNGRHTLTVA